MNESQNRPRWDSNPQSSDSKSDALSVGPRGHEFTMCFILFIKYHIKLGSGSTTSTTRVLHCLLGKFCILGKLDGSTEQIRTCHIMKLRNTNIYIKKLYNNNKLKSVNRSEIKKFFRLRSSKTKNRSKGHCCTQTFFRTVESVRAPRY